LHSTRTVIDNDSESFEVKFPQGREFVGIGQMTEKRKTDLLPQTRFRSGRFFKDNGKWFFNTREGTIEGPYEKLSEAEDRLKDYIKILNSGFMPKHSTLELEPLEIEKESAKLSPSQSKADTRFR
jgi:Domain of unknown function (DUF6316)